MKQYNNRSGKALHRMVRGFTLIELLIVIAILGIIAAGVVTALNVTGTIGKANLAKVKTFAASIENDLSINQVGKWSFEDGLGDTVKDISGYGNNGDLGGTSNACPGAAACPTWKTATECGLGYRGCLSFDGVDDYVDYGNKAIFDPGSKSFSFGGWFKTTQIGNYHPIIGKGNETNNVHHYALGMGYYDQPTGTIYSNLNDGTHTSVDFKARSSASLNDGRWHFAFATVDRSANLLTLYIDGVENSEVNISALSSVNPTTRNLHSGWIFNGNFWNGEIDEVQIYNQALTSSQIQKLYAQGLPKHQLAAK